MFLISPTQRLYWVPESSINKLMKFCSSFLIILWSGLLFVVHGVVKVQQDCPDNVILRAENENLSRRENFRLQLVIRNFVRPCLARLTMSRFCMKLFLFKLSFPFLNLV